MDLDERTQVVPAIATVIEKYGDEEAFRFATLGPGAEYLVALFVKAGMRKFDYNWLVNSLDGDNADRVMDAAVALSILNDTRGLDALIKLANGWGPWDDDNVPRVDILNELHWLPVEHALRIKACFR